MARQRKEPRWLRRVVVDAIHADQVRQHGGVPRIRDENVLESALAQPRQKWEYHDTADVALLAASYAFGFARNHPYADGNKRIAFLTLITFLGLNDYDFETTDEDVVTTMLALADGSVTEPELADWVRARTQRQN